MKDNGKKWRTAYYEEKRQAKQALALRDAKKQATHYLRNLQQEWRGWSLIQLLLVIVNNGPLLAGELAVEQIELNQKNLSAEDRKFLQEVKAQLAGRRDCPRQLVGKA